jgi:hemerythrin-like domain-containing protein
MAREMTHIHNMILRSLNSIYQQAPYVHELEDIKDLLQFTKLWHDNLEHHHDTEEKIFFPDLEKLTGKVGIMDGNIEQHQAFEPGLIVVGKYATETLPQNYDAEHLRAIIDSFAPILAEHLHDEIDTLMGLKEYPSASLMKAWQRSGDYAKSTGEKVNLTNPNSLL